MIGGVCGPPLGAVAFLLAATITRNGAAGIAALDVGFVTATLPFAYLLAFVPSVIAAAGNAVAARLTNAPGLRLVLALPIGALPFALSLAWLAEAEVAGQFVPGDLFSLGFAGAFVSLVSVALVDSLPAREV